MLVCSLKYGSSFEDYYDFRFWSLDSTERSTYAGTGVTHDFHNSLNNKSYRSLFRSKALFLESFGKLLGRDCLNLQRVSDNEFASWVSDHSVFVAKPSLGAQGHGVRFVDSDKLHPQDLLRTLLEQGLDIVEEPIIQHKALQQLNPSSVNTIRIVTVYTDGQVDIIGAILRMGVGDVVDNLTAGGIAAPLDVDSGIVIDTAISKNFWLGPYESHPVTHERILDFSVPYWNEILNLCHRAANIEPKVRTVGWDVAVTDVGPVLVEGNDNWGKLLWQLPMRRGGLDVLRRYADI